MTRDEYNKILTDIPETWFHERLWRFCRNQSLLPDLAQDVRLKALDVADDTFAPFKNQEDVRKYVYGILRKFGIDTFNKNKARLALFVEMNSGIRDANGEHQNPEPMTMNHQELAFLLTGIDSLPEKLRAAAEPYFLDDLSAKEVAEKLGTTMHDVRARLAAAGRHCERQSRRPSRKARPLTAFPAIVENEKRRP